jgi:peptidyl-prolyl cis-trans isomerase D
MLGIMRKYKQSIIIKFVFAIIVFSFIGTIFLVWGRGEKGLSGSEYAAKVDNTKITYDEYQKYLYRMRDMYMQIYGKSVTPEMEKQMGLKKLALDSLIDNALLREAAEDMGLKVTKDDVAKAIASIPAFQKDGAFDFELYQQRLRGERITPSSFEDSIKNELLIKEVRQKIRDKVTVSDEEALQAFRKQNDKVDLFYASFSPAEVKGEVKVTDQDLNYYIQEHQEQFKTPEQISLYYTVLDPARVAAKLSVTGEEAQAYYQKNIDRFQGKEGFLPFAEVKEKAMAYALQAKASNEAYGMAADALNRNLKNNDIKAAATELGTKVNETPLFTVTAPAAQLAGDTEVIKRAFALKTGELGGPVETAKGIYLFKVKERQPAAVPPLDKIKFRVEPLAAVEKANQLAQKKAMDTQALLASGKSTLKMQETGLFGFSTKGDIPHIGVSQEIMDAAFKLTAAAPLAQSPFRVNDSWYVIKLDNRVEMNKEEFAKQKEKIKLTLLPQKQQDALNAWMKELKSKSKIVINQALLAE